ncbi:MAG: hypothetical protein LBG64_03495, partial [Pseudomonadales bacterium]|nr:hypothetical protein [Pseudomonadales bacterium]
IIQKLRNILDHNWQNSSKREEFLKGVKQTIQEVILREYKDEVQIDDFHKFLNRFVDIVVKVF